MRINDITEIGPRPALKPLLLLLAAVTLGCGSKPPSISEVPADAGAEQLQSVVKDLQSSMGTDEQTYAEHALYAAEYATLEAARLSEAGSSDAARAKLLEAGSWYEEAHQVAERVSNDRVLSFPEDRSLGKISVRPWNFQAEYREFAEAKGAVRIESGLMVQFSPARTFNDADLEVLCNTLHTGDIQYFTFAESQVSSAGLAQLPRLKGVIDLSLYQKKLDDAAWEGLARMRSLRHLNLIGANVTTDIIKRMGIFPSIEDFSLDESVEGFTEEALLTIRQYPRLRSLVLRGGTMSDVALAYVSHIHELERLWIGGRAVTRHGVELLRDLPHFNELVLLNTSATDEEVQALSATMPKVRIDSMGTS